MRYLRRNWKLGGLALIIGIVAAVFASSAANGGAKPHGSNRIAFDMVRSTASENAGCLTKASAHVSIKSVGPVEIMKVKAEGLPAKTDFDFFVIQVPNTPFGLSWYQGDIETDHDGDGAGTFIGRFSIETFIVAPGVASAPLVHDQQPFPDATSNPQTGPVHTFHLGLWFNDPADAVNAGCANSVTPFNGDHHAGPQALSTKNYANDQGPLRMLTP